MPLRVLYETSARATGGRDGHAATLDGSLDVKLTTPKELGGPGGDGNNPEQLFAAGYAACFLNAMKFIALKSRSSFPADASVTATVGIGPNADGGFGLAICALDLAAGTIGRGREEFDGAGAQSLPLLQRDPQQH
jgi:Ohr subfamily peroxiredoxin